MKYWNSSLLPEPHHCKQDKGRWFFSEFIIYTIVCAYKTRRKVDKVAYEFVSMLVKSCTVNMLKVYYCSDVILMAANIRCKISR